MNKITGFLLFMLVWIVAGKLIEQNVQDRALAMATFAGIMYVYGLVEGLTFRK